ncbi:MAG: hypothetical protein N4A61_06330 [Pelagimonas sp.]|jgi:hypothetical protein|nr:hypothetical protein [Pelagimonas sp.]
MKQILFSMAFGLVLMVPTGALAECFVAYKAKQDSPLRLHFGVLSLPGDCPSKADATAQASRRLTNAGWTLLTITQLSETPPSLKTKADAGEHYLRY